MGVLAVTLSVFLLALMSVAPVSADDDLESLLPQEEPKPLWQRAIEYWDSLDWFRDGCRDGTLPDIPSYLVSLHVLGKGNLDSSGWRAIRGGPFLGPEFELVNPDAFISFSTDSKMTIGLYCLTVTERVEVRLSCWRLPVIVCADDAPVITLGPGGHFILVGPEGSPRSWYRVEMRCIAPYLPGVCAGGVSHVRFYPPSDKEVWDWYRTISSRR